MARSWGRRRARGRSRRQRLLGCLLWLVGVLVLLIILSVLFGSFQLGTKSKGMTPPRRPAVTAMPASGPGTRAR
jgi:hypothetical protein